MNISPLTNKNNVVFYKSLRITIFNECAIRIEKDSSKKWCDEKTQFAINRNFEDFSLATKEKENHIVLFFKGFEVHIYEEIEKSFILKDEKKIKLLGNKSIGGTYITVDGMDGEKLMYGKRPEFVEGILTYEGVFTVFDQNSYLLDKDDNIIPKRNEDELDAYVFFSFFDKQKTITTYYEISGFPPVLPKYVFGNWWSRYYPYTQAQYDYLMKRFKKEEIPFTVSIIDMDWHYSWSNGRNLYEDSGLKEEDFFKVDESGNKVYIPQAYQKSEREDKNWRYGRTGYTVNKKLFYDFPKLLKDVHDLGLKVGLNLHPADGLAFFEDNYSELALANGIDPKSKESVPFDFTNQKFISSYFDIVLKPFTKEGVDFWWIDWQQGEDSKLPGLTPLWLCNHYFYKEAKKYSSEPIILSRFASCGGHRYPLGFSGDAFQTFDSLKYLVKMTVGASDCAFTYWSHDIGGHQEGYKDGDLYLKFVEFGVFSPINRLHCSCNDIINKDPDLFINGYSDLIKDTLRLRHKMIPYLYSFSFVTHNEGRPLIRPLYYDDYSKKAYKYKDEEYIFADNLLVAPFTKKESGHGISKKNVYFSSCDYYDIKFGYHYKANKEINIYRERGELPVFLKEGGYFVLSEENHTNSIENPLVLQVITTKESGSYTLYEKENSNLIKTIFKNIELGENKVKFTIKTNSSLNRVFNYKILNVFSIKNIEIKNAGLSNVYTEGNELEFAVQNIQNKDQEVEVVVEYNTFKDTLDEIKFYLDRRINYVDDLNRSRIEVYDSVHKANSINEIKDIITDSNLKNHNKKLLLEIVEGLD